MTNAKTTKRALWMSVIALLLCFTMLLGTTFAWFTDSVTSANNIIASGNLDIELEYWDGEDWVDVADKSNILTNDLWEPGVTEVAYFRIANAGSLALKYQFGINIVSETEGVNVAGEAFKLSDYIRFGVVENVNGESAAYATREAAVAAVAEAKKISAGYTKAAAMISGDEVYLALVVWMPTEVGNAANHNGTAPEIQLGINVVATQMTKEEDSFGSDYDAGAPWCSAADTAWYFDDPTATEFTVSSAEELAGLAAIVNGTATAPVTTYAATATTVQDTFAGKTVKLSSDIDLNNLPWTPIGVIGASSTDFTYAFRGTFDGQGHTISNLNVANEGWAGVFGIAYKATIKNLKVDGATINSNRMAAAIVGQLYGSIDNCHVTNANIVAVPNATAGGYDNGDKVGGIVGWIGDNGNNHTLANCTVNGLTICGYRDIGGIAGYVAYSTTVENNKVTNATITGDQSVNFYGHKDYNVNVIWGRNSVGGVGVIDINNAYENVTIQTVDVADNAAAAQKALDNATAGTIIKLLPGVNYGTLYLRPVAGQENTVTDCDYLVYRNEMLRKVEDLTIVGAPGATVDAIQVISGHIEGSTGYVVDINNLVIDSVMFTDDYVNPNTAHRYSAPLFFDLSYININGLTVKNCELTGNNATMNFVYLYGSGNPTNSTFATAAKNITITGNTVDGIARLCELRQTENVTITNNTIKNTTLHGMLLAVDNGVYTGNVTITGNTAVGINERFVRADGMGDAVVVIKDNTIVNYFGEDSDYIKVTNANNVTVENNTLASIGVKDTATAQAALDKVVPGTTIQLQPGVNYGTLYLRPYAGAAATKVVDWIGNNYGWETYTLFEDVTIVGAPGATVDAIEIEGGTYYHTEHSQAATYPVMLSLVELKNVVIDGVTFTGKGGYDPQGHGNAINLAGNNIKVNGLTLKNCVLENEDNNARLLYKTEGTTHVHKYAYEGVEYTFVGNLKDITVTGCTFNGGYMGIELRETENLTITNNVFNVADRNILLPVNTGCTYTGNVTITGNVSNNAKERFVRADGMGDAVVVIKDNTINNYMASDADYIKVTNANNVTIENNTKIDG